MDECECSIWYINPLDDETGKSGNRGTPRSGTRWDRPTDSKNDNPDTVMTDAPTPVPANAPSDAPGNTPINEGMKKGKGKRSYESEDEKEDLNENLKKPKSGEYRDDSEQYESSDDYSEDEEIDDKKTLIFRRPDVISEDINELSKTLRLIEDAKTLDSRLPTQSQWLNNSVSKLASRGVVLDKNEGTVKEQLERNEHFTRKELERTEAERNRCEDTLDAEGSIIKTFKGAYVYVKVTQEQSDHINEVQVDLDDDFTWPDKIGIGSSQNSETESDRESDRKSNKESNIKSDNQTKNDKDTSDYNPMSSGVTATEDSSNPLPSDAQTTITEAVKAARSWFDIVMNGTGSSSDNPSENPSSANLSAINAPSTDPSQKIEEKPGSSVSTDNKNTDDNKLTPGDFIDDLPQDMPSWIDDMGD